MPTATSSDLRLALLALRENARGDLTHVWSSLEDVVAAALDGDAKSQAQVTQVLNSLLPGLVGDYQTMAASLAADWYDDQRQAQDVAGSFTARTLMPPQNIPSLVGWSFAQAKTVQGFEQFIGGGAELRITQAANGTIMASNLADPAGRGWEREAGPDSCWFCQMLATRGAVYRSEATATFAPHNDCHCVAVCAWTGVKVRVGDANGENGQAKYTPTDRNLLGAVRQRMHSQAKQWAEQHGLIEGDIALPAAA